MQTGIRWDVKTRRWFIYIDGKLEGRADTPTAAHEVLDALLELREYAAIEEAARMSAMRERIDFDPLLQIGDVIPRRQPVFNGRESRGLYGKERAAWQVIEWENTLKERYNNV